jgi:hypothetical protein
MKMQPMNKDETLTVTLSKKTTSVTLPRDPGIALQHFMAAGRKWVSWSELHDAGVISPVNAILELKKLGARIETKYKDTVTSKWEILTAAPHYKYCEWHFDAAWPHNTTNPYKEPSA